MAALRMEDLGVFTMDGSTTLMAVASTSPESREEESTERASVKPPILVRRLEA